MPLMLPRPRGQTVGAQNNLAATPSATVLAVNVAAAASAHTKTTSPVTLIASTNVESCALVVTLSNNSVTGVVRNGLVDIMIGSAGSEVVIAANLSNTAQTSLNAGPGPVQFFLPFRIPAGARISARHQNSTASQICQVACFVIPMGDFAPWPLFAGCEMIGADTSTSSLVPITAGTSGTESAWTSIGSPTGQTYHAVMPVVSTHNVTSMTSVTYHLEWGYSSTMMGERYFAGNNVELVGNMIPTALLDYAQIPVGTQLEMRAEGGGATVDALQYGLLAFY